MMEPEIELEFQIVFVAGTDISFEMRALKTEVDRLWETPAIEWLNSTIHENHLFEIDLQQIAFVHVKVL